MSYYAENPLERNLFAELKSVCEKGVLLYMDGRRSTPRYVAAKASVSGGKYSYMRDYIFVCGMLKEIRFDRVRNPLIK